MNFNTFCQHAGTLYDREAFQAYVAANHGPNAEMELMEWWIAWWLYMEPFPGDPVLDEREPVSQMEEDYDSAW